MNLHFVCRCTGSRNLELPDDMKTDFDATMKPVLGCRLNDLSGGGESPGSAGGPLLLRFECAPQEDALEQTRQLISALSQLSSDHGVGWSVGHQMESCLGSISDGIPDADLEAELATSIRVAFALGQIIVDDELVEEDPPGLEYQTQSLERESDCDLESNDSWSGILDATDEFVRFPKLDDL